MDQSPATFGDELRRLRAARGLSLRELAKRAHHSKSVLWEWERGQKLPKPDDVARVDEVLDAGGALTAAAGRINPAPPDGNRLARVAAAPRTVDAAALDALAGVLANTRRLEDVVGARQLLVATASPLRLAETLADEARGPLRSRVVDLAGQWAQFAGWLRAATGQRGKARDWYARTLEHATEVSHRDLVATALSMRGHLAWLAGQPGAVVGLSAAAAQHADSPSLRAMAAQQEARGHALLGNADEVERQLARAEELIEDAAERPDEQPPWVYFYSPGYLQMQRGLAYRLLGRPGDAIEALAAGLKATGDDLRGSEFVAQYVLHLAEAHSQGGNWDVAEQLVDEVRQVAAATGSARLAVDVARLERRPRQ